MQDQATYFSPGTSRFSLTHGKLSILLAVMLMAFYNLAFFRNVIAIYPLSLSHAVFICSLAVLFTALVSIVLTLVSSRYTTRPLFILLLLVSSLTSYFMDSYNVVIDDTMLQNMVATSVSESLDLFSFKLLLYVLLLGVIPSIFVYKVNIRQRPLRQELFGKAKLLLIVLLLITAQLFMLGKTYASFFREHKPLRQYSNPLFYLYSAGKYAKQLAAVDDAPVKPIGLDARIAATDVERELLIFVLGETARADHFSLNGYAKQTNPRLSKENVISFPHMASCGTSTAVSVPCMFSGFERSQYDDGKGRATENLLDVLTHAGVHALWRDNNSDSKGVALRVSYEDFKTPDKNHRCDVECRDEGMLEGLQAFIDQHPTGDIMIILHQMGNHGPAYYKRYPKAFERFTPACQSNLLDECSEEEISNAYDNAILYTDYFLAKVIELLKQNTHKFEAAMAYISDHGESLGEKGLYLHGMPYFMAPDAQKNPAALFWFADNYDDIDKAALKAKAREPVSHDHIFHTILGLMEVESDVYDKGLDMIIHAEN